jgi:hypothetical protein
MPKRHGLWNKKGAGYLSAVGPPMVLFRLLFLKEQFFRVDSIAGKIPAFEFASI